MKIIYKYLYLIIFSFLNVICSRTNRKKEDFINKINNRKTAIAEKKTKNKKNSYKKHLNRQEKNRNRLKK